MNTIPEAKLDFLIAYRLVKADLSKGRGREMSPAEALKVLSNG